MLERLLGTVCLLWITVSDWTLFDEAERSFGRRRETESAFHFLNRAGGDSWQRVRNLLDGWYAAFLIPAVTCGNGFDKTRIANTPPRGGNYTFSRSFGG